jgi:hypothetical protein
MAGVLAGPLMVAPQGALTLDYLIVGGGGGGGAETGGGGGGGGVKQGQIPLQAGCAFIISVGAGGTGAGTGSVTNNTTTCREYIFAAETFSSDLSNQYVCRFAKQVSNLGANGGSSFLCSLNADNNCFVVAGGGGGVSVPDVSICCNIAYMQCTAIAGASGGGGGSRSVPDNRINGGAGNTPAASPLQGASGGRGSGPASLGAMYSFQYGGGGGGGGPLGTVGGSSYNNASTTSGPYLYGSSSGHTTFTGVVKTTGLTTVIDTILPSTAGMVVGQGVWKTGSGGGSVGNFAKITAINSSTSITVQATTNNTSSATAATFVYYSIASAKGGDGTASAITGTNTYYGGGGGGSVSWLGVGVLSATTWSGYCTLWPGGLGGGGNGGTRNVTAATDGTANCGGGGGGSGSNILKYTTKSGSNTYDALHRGGHGGSGIVILRYKTGALPVTCTGNPVASTVGGDTVLCFTGTGQICFGQPVTSIPIEYVVVGGGGSGASIVEQSSGTNISGTGNYFSYLGGGGGAGGYLSSNTNILPNITIPISIGAGGAAAGTTATANLTARRVGNSGQTTCFGQIIANGGGGGGSRSANVTSLENTTNSGGCHGGSGGGGAGMLTATSTDINVRYNSAFTSAGIGNCMLITGLRGNSGGTGRQYAAGGGGGASTAGVSTTLTSDGGNGCVNTTIWPFTNINAYAAGGGGAIYVQSYLESPTTFYSRGGNSNISYNRCGLGGSGSVSANTSSAGTVAAPTLLRPQNAHPCSWGSGGGGLGIWKRNSQPSNSLATQLGLSGQGTGGVVFIKYSAKYPAAAVTGSPTYCTDATHRYYRFTGTGTFNIASAEFPDNYNLSTQKSTYVEGEKIIVHIITKGLANGTQLNWTQTGTLSTSDFLESVNSGVITLTDNFASLTFTTLRKFTTTNKTFIFNLLDLSNTVLASLASITITGNNQVEYLIVGGGGAGGNDGGTNRTASGGGGGGQVCFGTIGITAGTTCAVTVGSGGASVPTAFGASPGNGQPSSIFGITAVGGGVGAGCTFTAATGATGILQNSTTLGGGGGGQAGRGASGSGVTPTVVGTAAGNGGSTLNSLNESTGPFSSFTSYSGGGGGAAGPGNSHTSLNADKADPTQAGGIGCLFLQWAIDTNSGDRGYFGGGGAGSKSGTSSTGQFGYTNYGGGGLGIGQNQLTNYTSSNGMANTGGGGGGSATGGGRHVAGWTVSKNGGSGLVIVRYCANVSAATGGTIYCQNGYVYHKFIATGNLQF